MWPQDKEAISGEDMLSFPVTVEDKSDVFISLFLNFLHCIILYYYSLIPCLFFCTMLVPYYYSSASVNVKSLVWYINMLIVQYCHLCTGCHSNKP